MYEDPYIDFEDVATSLAINKIVYDATGETVSQTIDSDDWFEAYYEAIDQVAELIARSLVDGYDTYVDKYCFPDMYRYYELCREYSRRHKIKFKRNPYVRKAYQVVNTEMNGINSYCIDWHLFAPQKVCKKKYPCLAVFTAPEFYQPVQLVESLYNIRCFYREETAALERELFGSTSIILLPSPTVKQEERNVAI